MESLISPPKLPLCYETGKNPRHKQKHTLDYLFIAEDEIQYLECKKKKQLLIESRDRPDFITYHPETDTFSSPAIERFLEGTGITYAIVAEDDINPIEAENIELLYDYTYGMNLRKYKKWLKEIVGIVSESDGTTVEFLLGKNVPPEYIYAAISLQDVYFPLTELTLLDVRNAFVFNALS
ncbi:hypothetical protein, partial [Reinekea sp. G2M2-21]|uniref:hypothetical protein n=1 Tax=Reinekea sp. G2M2-21 TaxID=2788942 RepID=UPI0018AB108F